MEAFKRHRAKLTRQLDRLIEKYDPAVITNAVARDQLDRIADQIEENYDDIYKTAASDEIDQHEEIYNSQDTKIALFRSRLQKEAEHTAAERSAASSPVTTTKIPEHRLPTLNLPTFGGEVTEWLSFADLFTSSIKNCEGLTGAQKLRYLKTALRGEAALMLQHVPTVDDNFEDAWELLRKRYEDKEVIVKRHVDRLLDHPGVTSREQLQSLVVTTFQARRALAAMAVNMEEALLQNIILRKADNETKKEWNHRRGESDNTDALLDFLNLRVKREAEFETTTSGRSRPPTNMPRPQQNSCIMCGSPHLTFTCPRFQAATIEDRMAALRNRRACFNCLSANHQAIDCKSTRTCKQCGKKHHTMVHQNQQPQQGAHASKVLHATRRSTVLLATAVILVTDGAGNQQPCRAILDQGSQSSFVSSRCVRRLQLPQTKRKRTFCGMGGEKTTVSQMAVTLTIASRHNKEQPVTVPSAHVLPHVTTLQPHEPVARSRWPHLKGLTLADPKFTDPAEVDILLGSDVLPHVLREGLRTGPSGTPAAMATMFGWVLFGPAVEGASEPSRPPPGTTLHAITCDTSMEQFWTMDGIPETSSIMTPEEEMVENHFQKTHQRGHDGRYEVRLPLTNNPPNLGSSRNQAVSRLLALERRFKRDPTFQASYQAAMRDYLAQGHMEAVPEEDLGTSGTYLPHHAVIKADSATTKLRVVFDCSAKSTNGRSLNDELPTGPRTQEDLFNILVRWRTHPVALTADITQMYRQVRVSRDDANHQRVLWREGTDKPIGEFRLPTVIFGSKTAPYLATRTLNQLAEDDGPSSPEAAEVLRRDFYVDNLMSGAPTVEDAKRLVAELSNLLMGGGFPLRKWASNEQATLEDIPDAHRDGFPNATLGEVNALGLQWDQTNDRITTRENITWQSRTTRRTMLCDVASIFDPLGLMSPVTVRGKMAFQRLWSTELNWDEELPDNLKEEWLSIKKDLASLKNLKVPRHTPINETTILCGFADASEKAYGAVTYLRTKTEGHGIITTLVAAKTKVAPIKKVSLPRLELCAALLLARLIKAVRAAVKKPLPALAWTDSTVTLAWVTAHPSKWQTYVANRVAEISEELPAEVWRHVKGPDNPADGASRGISATTLNNCQLWWEGPEWLRKEPMPSPLTWRLPDQIPEKKSTNAVLLCEDSSHIESHSSLHRLLRVTAWVLRFGHNCHSDQKKTGPLTAEEIAESWKKLQAAEQKRYLKPELKAAKKGAPLPRESRLLGLSPFLAGDGLLRVGGRLQNSTLSYEARHPVILPKESKLAELLIVKSHQDQLHGGIAITMAAVRKSVWVIGLPSATRKLLRRCITCWRHKTTTAQQQMGPLPKDRVQPTRAFQNTGCDFAGPIQIKTSMGRSPKTSKAYIAIFVCMATKAIHLEPVSSLSSEGFIAALRRFSARRGRPSRMYSDNGTNFVGANRELQALTSDTVKDFLANKKIEWSFIPPAAPNWGGLWEAGVKSTKNLLKKALGRMTANFEELTTLLAQIEAVLNSRPLCPMTGAPEDLEALTPGHFVAGTTEVAIPDADLMEVTDNRLIRWQRVQKIIQQFWTQWSAQYVTGLQQRTKWQTATRNMTQDTLVAIKDSNLPPSRWKLGRVIKTHVGSDGLVRAVTLRTAAGTLLRPINAIGVLPGQSDDVAYSHPANGPRANIPRPPTERTTETTEKCLVTTRDRPLLNAPPAQQPHRRTGAAVSLRPDQDQTTTVSHHLVDCKQSREAGCSCLRPSHILYNPPAEL